MKILNVYLTTAIWLLSLAAIAQHSYPTKKAVVDSAYEKLNEILYGTNHIWSYKKSDSVLYRMISIEKANHDYRKMGLKLWFQFPNDQRRYDWFNRTLENGVSGNNYWSNIEEGMKQFISLAGSYKEYSIPINQIELKEWERSYPKMLKEYKHYAEISKNLYSYNNVLERGLRSFFHLSFNKAYRENKKMDFARLNQFLLPAAERIFKYKGDANPELYVPWVHMQKGINGCLRSYYDEYGLNEKDMAKYFLSLEKHPLPEIRRWANQQSNVFLLMEEGQSFEFKHKTIDGEEIDFEKLRGKVVLVDFWSTWCSGCISRMPAIKKVYDQYKDRDFVVISAALDDMDKLEEIKAIEKKIGADWPTLIIGGPSNKNSLGGKIWKRYNFFGVPQILLFDKKGKLVMLNDRLTSGDFEPDVKGLLAGEYNSN